MNGKDTAATAPAANAAVRTVALLYKQDRCYMVTTIFHDCLMNIDAPLLIALWCNRSDVRSELVLQVFAKESKADIDFFQSQAPQGTTRNQAELIKACCLEYGFVAVDFAGGPMHTQLTNCIISDEQEQYKDGGPSKLSYTYTYTANCKCTTCCSKLSYTCTDTACPECND